MLIVWGLLIAIAAALLVLMPILRPGPAVEPRTPFSEPEDDPLEQRKELALAALKEIEFDRATGKLSEADYQAMLTRYTKEAVEALREVDAAAAAAATPAAVPAAAGGNGHAAAAASAGPAGAVAMDDQAIERLIAEARQAGRKTGRRYCINCGAVLEGSGRFCVECGARV